MVIPLLNEILGVRCDAVWQILLNIEHRLMSQAAAPCDYDSLTTMQKVEVFEMSLKHTAGQDLYKVSWSRV